MAKKKNAASRSKNPAVRAQAKPASSSKVPQPRRPKTFVGMWIAAARVRTLALAVSPVAFGTGVAASVQSVNWLNAVLALVVALGLQIAVNFSNDYSDGIRGTDATRVGPFRLTASGAVKPKSVRNAAFIFFGIAAAAGLALVFVTGMYVLAVVGAVAIVAAWLYTGGKNPYGYAGFGELIAFVFFGPVAVFGTVWVQYSKLAKDPFVPFLAAGGALALGFLAAAVLLVNNLRDIHLDEAVGKRTLAVILGVTNTKIVFTFLLLASIGLLIPYPTLFPMTILGYLSLLALLPAILIVFTYRSARELVTALQLVTVGSLLFGVLVGIGLTRMVF